MTRKLVSIIAMFLFMTGLSPVMAQNFWTTPGGSGVNGAVGMCLNASNQAVPCSNAGVLASPVSGASPAFPSGAIPITASATGTTAATTATLAGVSGKTTYLCGLSIRANATAAATGNATVTGTISGTMNFSQWTAPLASGIGIIEPLIGPSCVPASAVNTAIAVISAAPGAGGTVSVSAWGYQL